MSTSNARLEKGKLGPEQGFSSHQQTVEFMDLMAEAIRDGYRFVPVLGAGISSSAGVPVVSELSSTVLPFWVFRSLPINPWPSLALNDTKCPVFDASGKLNDIAATPIKEWLSNFEKGGDGRAEAARLFKSTFHTYELRPWLPGKGYWPDLRLESLRNQTMFGITYARRVILQFLAWLNHHPTLFHSWHSPLPVGAGDRENKQRVICLNRLFTRALAALDGEWLDMIDYLAKLSSEVEGRRNGDPTIPDSIFTHLCERREPALPHRMLAALSPVWRSTVLLTTNFDPLIEEAYRRSGKAPKTFDVPKTTPLPGAGLVLAEESVVKLHGGRFGLRADHSLDSTPTDEDRETFLSYLLGRPVPRDETDEVLKSAKVALVLLGTRVEDIRLRQLLRHAKKLHALRIFYVGRSRWMVEDEWHRGKNPFSLKCPDPGLFLLHLFQHLTGTIPASGCFFPTSWRNARPPLIEFEPEVEARQRTCDGLIDDIKAALDKSSSKLVLVRPEEGERWGLTLCSRIFQGGKSDCLGNSDPLWLDLEDVARPADILVRMMLAAGHLGGEQDPQISFNAADLDWDDAKQVSALQAWVSYVFAGRRAATGRAFLFFISLQEGAGIRSGPEGERAWGKSNVIKLVEMLEKLQNDPRNGLRVVMVAARSGVSGTGGGSCSFSGVLADPAKFEILSRPTATDQTISLFNIDDTVRAGLRWLELTALQTGGPGLPDLESLLGSPREWKTGFLALLCGLRGDTYPACVARAFEHYAREVGLKPGVIGAPTPVEIRQLCHLWLGELDQSFGVVRSKPGGFIWMNSGVARKLGTQISDRFDVVRPWILDFQLARWHGRLLLASSDPLAAVEAVFYLLKGLRKMRDALGDPIAASEAYTICKYALLLLNTAKGLFEVHISSQFARQSLDEAAGECLNALRVLGDLRESNPQLSKVLVELYILLKDCGSSVALRQAEFSWLLRLRDERAQEPESRLGKSMECLNDNARQHAQALFRVHALGGLVCHRRYDEALGIAHDQWLLLAGNGPCASDSWNMLMPPQPDGAPKVNQRLFSLARSLASEMLQDGRQPQLKLLCRLGRWLVYHHLSRSQIDYLHDNLDATGEEPHPSARMRRIRQLDTCLGFYHFTSELLRSIQDTQDGFVFSENVRLRAHAALAQAVKAAMLFAPGGSSRGDPGRPPVDAVAGSPGASAAGRLLATPEADLLLVEALTFIEEFPLKDEGITAGVLSLRRAEIQIIKVATSGALKRYRVQLKTWPPALRDGDFLQREPDLDSLREQLTLTSAFAHDALRYLREAETALLRSPKSRWWWTVYAALKMKAVEYLYVLRAAWAEDEWRRSRIAAVGDTEGGGRHAVAFDPYITDKLVTWDAVQYFRGGVTDLVEGKGLDDFFNLSRILFSYLQTLKACLRFHIFRSQCLLAADVVEREFLRHRMRDFADDLSTLIVAAEKALPQGAARGGILESAIRYHHTVLVGAKRALKDLKQNVINTPTTGEGV